MRFEDNEVAALLEFYGRVSEEVASRLKSMNAKGSHITLKIKKKQEGAGTPIKFMGHVIIGRNEITN